MLFTLTGCKAFSYWEGLTKNQSEKYILRELKEKYGEEFVVLQTYKEPKNGYTNLWADCSPKSNEDIVFQVKVFPYRDGSREFNDMYIQSIVREEMKNSVDTVLSARYDNFASEVYIQGLMSGTDSGIRSASEATIENYTEALPENYSRIWIILSENEIGKTDEIAGLVEEFTKNFHYTHAYIYCFYVPDDVLIQCIEETNKDPSWQGIGRLAQWKNYPELNFSYEGDLGELRLVYEDLN